MSNSAALNCPTPLNISAHPSLRDRWKPGDQVSLCGHRKTVAKVWQDHRGVWWLSIVGNVYGSSNWEAWIARPYRPQPR